MNLTTVRARKYMGFQLDCSKAVQHLGHKGGNGYLSSAAFVVYVHFSDECHRTGA